MKICYVDESGNNSEDPCLVMVGVLVDSYRLNRTREEFAEIFDDIQRLFEKNLRELKGSKMFFGRDRWRNVNPEDRKRIVGHLCKWISDRKHYLVLSAIDRSKLNRDNTANVPEQCRDEWLAGGLHIALQIQKAHQKKSKNKGHTFLIFDDNKMKADNLSELLWQPPEWTDDYYDRKKKQIRLDQIVDTTFTIKSHHAGLVQVADLFAFIFRRYAEMKDFGMPEGWAGEQALIGKYVEALSSRLLARVCRWPKRPNGASSRWFNSIAPASLMSLGK
ncbi:MAG: hypothetical protein KatS3mg119_0395 [Rhodothalassiaceae bacterium]|nr:MAG: hypothetical protein KatS3mg119_0395 [Rhodothalassiaceae bacterium]